MIKKITVKPFIKWVGGKRSILNILIERLPKSYTSYNECFVGGGALFFELQPEHAVLSDINSRLIITYIAIRDSLDQVIDLLKKHKEKHSKSYYLQARDYFSHEQDPTVIASLFIYLNKTCFNGLYRVNQSGKFNVPMGDYKNPAILDENNLRNVSKVLQNVEITQCPFYQSEIKNGAFYYLDPPYHNTYSSYDSNKFGDIEHKNLADFCKQLNKAGCYFMLSNSDTDLIRELYKDFVIEGVIANRFVSCTVAQRGKAGELLIRNY